MVVFTGSVSLIQSSFMRVSSLNASVINQCLDRRNEAYIGRSRRLKQPTLETIHLGSLKQSFKVSLAMSERFVETVDGCLMISSCRLLQVAVGNAVSLATQGLSVSSI